MNTIDTAGIASLLGCTRQHVTYKITKRADFPAPVVDLTRRIRRWDRSEVERWIKASRQCPRPTLGSTSTAAA